MATRQRVGMRAPAPSVTKAPVDLRPLSLIEGTGSVQVVGAPPAEVDLIAYQGDDLRWTIPVLQGGSPANLVGCTILSQLRISAEDDTILALLTTVISSSNVEFWLASTDSANLPSTGAVWDAQLTDSGGFVTTFVAGKVTVIEEVSRA